MDKKQFIIFFEKPSADPANIEKVFRGRVIIEAEEKINAIHDFLEWAKIHDKFQDTEKFYFEISEIEYNLNS